MLVRAATTIVLICRRRRCCCCHHKSTTDLPHLFTVAFVALLMVVLSFLRGCCVLICCCYPFFFSPLASCCCSVATWFCCFRSGGAAIVPLSWGLMFVGHLHLSSCHYEMVLVSGESRNWATWVRSSLSINCKLNFTIWSYILFFEGKELQFYKEKKIKLSINNCTFFKRINNCLVELSFLIIWF